MSPASFLYPLMLRPLVRRRCRRIAAWCKDPRTVQERTLMRILRRAENTAWGRDHGYRQVRSLDEFQKRVPTGDYLSHLPYIERAMKGEPDVLWPGTLPCFAVSSGTTAGATKHLPLSNEGVASNLKAARDIICLYLAGTGNYSLFGGKILYLGGSTALTNTEGGARLGDLSAIMDNYAPWYARRFRLPPRDVASLTDWEEKVDRIARLCAGADVRMFTGVPSWQLVAVERILKHARAAGRRAESLSDIWPAFSLLVTGGVAVGPYRETFRRLIGGDFTFFEVYPASEGFIAMTSDPAEGDLLLMLDYGIFYEFVPVEELEKEHPSRLAVWQVEPDRQYAILMTTPSGLCAYAVGDTVRFTRTRPPKLVVTGRTRHFLSAFGEHMIVEEAEAAVAAACRESAARVFDFTVAPVYPTAENPLARHQWLVEFRGAPPADMEAFGSAADRTLCERNEDYRTHRVGGTGLAAPEIVPIPEGTIVAYMGRIGKLGGQHKVPRLCNDREHADAILELVKSRGGAV